MEKEQNKIEFTKMHGAGNDYIYLDATHDTPLDLSGLAVMMGEVISASAPTVLWR